ncbi:response regulator transcription factor [Christensenellaceae bacterium OttesenSCG-928-K19]|nr:response regulator transcription factor [Christensenellaceae bacterium OttesenSCG-928-K19]
MKLLIIEDEEDLLEMLVRGFEKLGYATDGLLDGEEGLEAIQTGVYDLVVLDLNLPGMDGIDILQKVREEDPEQRIIVLTARAEYTERVKGLNLGANDYLVKPFDFGELIARVQNLLRRRIVQQNAVMECKGIRIDTTRRIALDKNGKAINLTTREYMILEYLAMHAGTPVSAEELIEHIWADDEGLFSNAVKVHISQLRKKLREHTTQEVIATQRAMGYIIEKEGDMA